MRNYLRRFRRYLSDGGDDTTTGDADHYEGQTNQQFIEQQPTSSSISPEGQQHSGNVPRKLHRTRTLSSVQRRKISANKHLSLGESSEEENSTARLSRRSSVLVSWKGRISFFDFI